MWGTAKMKQPLIAAMLVGYGLALPGCNGEAPQDEEEYLGPLLGVWEEIVDQSNKDDPLYVGNCEVPDYGFSGTFHFKRNNEFRFDGVFGTIAGSRGDILEGTFIVQSDSILILNSTDYADEWIYQLMDTLYYSFLTDSMFVEIAEGGLCRRFWKKIG